MDRHYLLQDGIRDDFNHPQSNDLLLYPSTTATPVNIGEATSTMSYPQFLRKLQEENGSLNPSHEASSTAGHEESIHFRDGFVALLFFVLAVTLVCCPRRNWVCCCHSNRTAENNSDANSRRQYSTTVRQQGTQQPQRRRRPKYRNVGFEALLTETSMRVESNHFKTIVPPTTTEQNRSVANGQEETKSAGADAKNDGTRKSQTLASNGDNDSAIRDVEIGGEQTKANAPNTNSNLKDDSIGQTEKSEDDDELSQNNGTNDSDDMMQSSSTSFRQLFHSQPFSWRQTLSSFVSPGSTTLLELPDKKKVETQNMDDTQPDDTKNSSNRLVPTTCAICLSTYETGDIVSWAANANVCCHAFHTECIVHYAQMCFKKHAAAAARRDTATTNTTDQQDMHKDERLDIPCPLCRNSFLTYYPVRIEQDSV